MTKLKRFPKYNKKIMTKPSPSTKNSNKTSLKKINNYNFKNLINNGWSYSLGWLFLRNRKCFVSIPGMARILGNVANLGNHLLFRRLLVRQLGCLLWILHRCHQHRCRLRLLHEHDEVGHVAKKPKRLCVLPTDLWRSSIELSTSPE